MACGVGHAATLANALRAQQGKLPGALDEVEASRMSRGSRAGACNRPVASFGFAEVGVQRGVRACGDRKRRPRPRSGAALAMLFSLWPAQNSLHSLRSVPLRQLRESVTRGSPRSRPRALFSVPGHAAASPHAPSLHRLAVLRRVPPAATRQLQPERTAAEGPVAVLRRIRYGSFNHRRRHRTAPRAPHVADQAGGCSAERSEGGGRRPGGHEWNEAPRRADRPPTCAERLHRADHKQLRFCRC